MKQNFKGFFDGNGPAWLSEMINEGYVRICVENKEGTTFFATDTGLQEITNETTLKKAETK